MLNFPEFFSGISCGPGSSRDGRRGAFHSTLVQFFDGNESMNALRWIYALVLLGIGAVLGHLLTVSAPLAVGDAAKPGAAKPAQTVPVRTPGKDDGLYLRQSPGNATADSHQPEFRLGENH